MPHYKAYRSDGQGPSRAAPRLEPKSHRGLYFERYYSGYSGAEWESPKDAKLAFLEKIARQKCGDDHLLKRYQQRRNSLFQQEGSAQAVFSVKDYFVSGMGLPHPVENGFSWHPIFGVPYLSGAAVKGMLSAWYHFTGMDKAVREKLLGNEKQSATLICHDAIPIKPVKLSVDVLTAHMGNWYSQGETLQKQSNSKADLTDWENLPSDHHEPLPVPFLVVQSAAFHLGITAAEDFTAEKALDDLEQALKYLGAGAKTASGYGRLVRETQSEDLVENHITETHQSAQDAAIYQLQQQWANRPANKPVAPADFRKLTLMLKAASQPQWSNEAVDRLVKFSQAILEQAALNSTQKTGLRNCINNLQRTRS